MHLVYSYSAFIHFAKKNPQPKAQSNTIIIFTYFISTLFQNYICQKLWFDKTFQNCTILQKFFTLCIIRGSICMIAIILSSVLSLGDIICYKYIVPVTGCWLLRLAQFFFFFFILLLESVNCQPLCSNWRFWYLTNATHA